MVDRVSLGHAHEPGHGPMFVIEKSYPFNASMLFKIKIPSFEFRHIQTSFYL